ncbi:MAG: hypothetical protein IT428_18930 [Planctomycetaceae bacterium]|nr:hypothetical protein [Planctomycetaceae bacterium]
MAEVLSQKEVEELLRALDPNYEQKLLDEIAQMDRLEELRDLFEPYLDERP